MQRNSRPRSSFHLEYAITFRACGIDIVGVAGLFEIASVSVGVGGCVLNFAHG